MGAEDALRESNRRKDEFLATLAHELRNPLAPIRYASRLFKANVPGSMIEDVGKMIERQISHMARLLDDLLDVSRLSRGVLELRREPIDLHSVITAAIDAARPLLESAEQRLILRVPATPLPVDGDAVRLTQILANLLDNASRYSEQGSEIVLAASEEDADFKVEVHDHGIGIAPEMLSKIFDLFTHDDRARARGGGLGVGLSLAQQLAALHGGKIEAQSDGTGRGSRFTIRLPRRTAAEEPLLQKVAAPEKLAVLGAAGTRVLVVDDNVDGANSLAKVLELAGYSVKVAYEGVSAFEIAELYRPNVALLDIGLPNISGLELARRIRGSAWGSATKLIAVTGWGQDTDRARTHEAGFDEHLTKPVDPDRILGLLARHAQQTQAAAQSA
jgi:CheY-like chemotaxis protein